MSEQSENSAKKGRERPLSPHLQVYKPQITSVLSITHRFSAIILAKVLPFFVLWLALGAFAPEWFATVTGWFGTILGKAVLFGITVALYYNICHGVRHVFWDYGKGFSLKTVTITAWLIIIVTAALSLYTWVRIIGGGTPNA